MKTRQFRSWRLIVVALCMALFASSCAHTKAGRKRQKIAIAGTAAAIVIVVGFAILAGSATSCEDTGDCPTPNPKLALPGLDR